jgi:hypothetical protein
MLKKKAPMAGTGVARMGICYLRSDERAGGQRCWLDQGIIGLVNEGVHERWKWGALRAWAGSQRVMDYFESDSLIDARKICIEGGPDTESSPPRHGGHDRRGLPLPRRILRKRRRRSLPS